MSPPMTAELPHLPARPTIIRWALMLVAVPLLLYLPSLGNDFVRWGDYSLIVKNPAIQSVSATTVKAVFTHYDPELYIPLTFLSYQFDHLIGGLHPSIYHPHTLVLHVINVLLVA